MTKVEFTESSFLHGYGESDFFEVLAGDYLKLRSQRGVPDVYELFGRNAAGDYLHVVYRIINEKGLTRVFHMNRMTGRQKRRYRRIIGR